jgi:hypothetical protein
MGWIISLVALSLLMTALTIVELRQPIRTSALRIPALSVGDRVGVAFAACTFTVAFIYCLTLLAAKILQ